MRGTFSTLSRLTISLPRVLLLEMFEQGAVRGHLCYMTETLIVVQDS